jgi:hypothetical protein
MTHLEPHITVRAVQPMVAALAALGHPADQLLAAASIDPAVLADVDGRIPTAR